jgi:hypothetical protein
MRGCLHSSIGERYAPCLQERWPDKLAVAEELVYPDFRIRLPSFLTPEHEKLWLQMWGQPLPAARSPDASLPRCAAACGAGPRAPPEAATPWPTWMASLPLPQVGAV